MGSCIGFFLQQPARLFICFPHRVVKHSPKPAHLDVGLHVVALQLRAGDAHCVDATSARGVCPEAARLRDEQSSLLVRAPWVVVPPTA